MTAPAIRIENLGKQYRIGSPGSGGNGSGGGGVPGGRFQYKSLRDSLVSTAKRPWSLVTKNRKLTEDNSFWALKDVSFEVQPGEVVGIIGRNGAGKSTLLKILSRITKPTTGHVELRGRVGSLLEVGTGFHPELTGRENIFLNGAILGMTRAEVRRKFDEIVAFSEIERFLDTPVKQYSSGMYTRLAFAVAAHLDPEILVVDEVLAVGDAAFQKKCLGKMKDVAGEGRTVLFVSHNMDAVVNLCKLGVVLDQGMSYGLESATKAINRYGSLRQTAGTEDLANREITKRSPFGPVLAKLVCRTDTGEHNSVRIGQSLDLELHLRGVENIGRVEIGVIFSNYLGQRITAFQSAYNSNLQVKIDQAGLVRLSIPQVLLTPSVYDMEIIMMSAGAWIDHVPHAGQVEVIADDFYGTGRLPHTSHGWAVLPAHWSVVNQSLVEPAICG